MVQYTLWFLDAITEYKLTVMIWDNLYRTVLILLKDPHSKNSMIYEFSWGYSDIDKANYVNDEIS